MNARMLREASGLELRNLVEQQRAALGILVAEIDVDLARLDRPGGDQHALEEAVRIGLEIEAILEGAGLAFIGIYGHQARLGLGTDEAPFAAGGEPGAPQPFQLRILDPPQHLLDRHPPRETGFDEPITAIGAVGLEAPIGRVLAMPRSRLRRGDHALDGRVLVQRMADPRHRRVVAAAHAGRADDAHVFAQALRQFR